MNGNKTPKPTTLLVTVIGILEYHNRFLLIRRIDDEPQWHGKWELPGGKLDPGETTLEAIRREMREETGVDVEQWQLLGVETHHWELSAHTQQTVLVIYRGQADSDRVTLDPAQNDEFRWVTVDEFFELGDHLANNELMIEKLRDRIGRLAASITSSVSA